MSFEDEEETEGWVETHARTHAHTRAPEPLLPGAAPKVGIVALGSCWEGRVTAQLSCFSQTRAPSSCVRRRCGPLQEKISARTTNFATHRPQVGGGNKQPGAAPPGGGGLGERAGLHVQPEWQAAGGPDSWGGFPTRQPAAECPPPTRTPCAGRTTRPSPARGFPAVKFAFAEPEKSSGG